MDHPTVSVKQEILEPDYILTTISGDSTDSSSDSSDAGDTNDDAYFGFTAEITAKNRLKHNRELDTEEEAEGGGGSGLRAKKPRAEGISVINAWPLGFLRPLPPPSPSSSLPSCQSVVLKVEPLSEIRPVDAWCTDEQVITDQVVRSSNCRQFWKAGDYEGDANENSVSSSVGMDHVRVHPKFLHSNATSHKWALGAFAELLDNSLDEVCNGATYVNVDMLKNKKDGSKMLLVEDDGGGMTPDKMRQCMSLGYSAKSKLANTIGQYGNGFKTSTMRLGADVIVFSRCPGNNGRRPTQSIGMLSYSFLRGTGKEDIVVPILDYEISDHGLKNLTRTSADDWYRNLATIIRWSPYSSEEHLLQQFNCMKEHGTRVVIYNLWEDEEEQLELDFDADPHDIQIRGVNRNEKNIQMAKQYPNSKHFLTYRHSLRSYVSILYLRLPPGFRIILRGVDVEHHNLEDDMMLTEEVTYRPQLYEGMPRNTHICANVKIGFVKDAYAHIDVQGFNVYHKNRLIKPFWRVWNAAGSDGRGVIGVLEPNFIEPAHDKQGFERTFVLARLEARLLLMQKNYWSSNCEKVGYAPRRRAANSSNTKSKSSKNEKTMKKDENNDHGSTSVETASKHHSDHKMVGSNLHVKINTFSNGERQGTAYCNAKMPTKLKEEKCDLGERSTENGVPATVDLLSELDRERERNKSLETRLRQAEQKVEELDKEQIALIDMLAMERTQRQEEEDRLNKSLMDANKTIEELREKMRQLEP
ncbi:hypothetical protein L484_017483 [Morus notabilis]|uniref:Morc S5 domain-containing protein n=1 Tax=Morus notabilis TaxID=981085 RepID=W9R7V5_9ROSA|nr:protein MICRORCHIDIA 7 [Morus notabilis]EXB40341.1 hypothetical protein L484_017483 [Morus notabilis]